MSNGDLWAWLGPNQGAGRIDFTEGTGTYISLLTSTYSGVTIDANVSNLLIWTVFSFLQGDIQFGLSITFN